MQQKKFKKLESKGITLIALVITIIVLLILAGVSIAMLTGENGILTQAQKAKNETEEAQMEEENILNTYDQYIELSKNGYIMYTDKNNDVAAIPAGFSVSEKEEEQIIKNGLVVKAPDESEFVWVPVQDINTMAQCSTAGGNCDLQLQDNGKLICITHNSTEIVGKLYSTNAAEDFGTANTTYYADSGLREPAVIVGNKDGNENDAEYYSVAGFDSIDDMLTQLKNEYKNMAESVAKYKGFYVSRYEISFIDATKTTEGTNKIIQSKANVLPITVYGEQGNMWYGIYKLQKEYASKSELENCNVSSSMIWGSQYDAMINWAKKGADAQKIEENTNGNHSGEKSYTGEYSNDKINNIYDLEGNLFESTLESHYYGAKVARGSAFSRTPDNVKEGARTPVYRLLVSPSWKSEDLGGRMSLYIK